MARDIPMDGPLTAEDRKYMEDRGRYAEIERLDNEFGRLDVDENETDEVTEPADEYDAFTNKELQAELEGRGLDSRGNKAEMIARLRENDAQGPL